AVVGAGGAREVPGLVERVDSAVHRGCWAAGAIRERREGVRAVPVEVHEHGGLAVGHARGRPLLTDPAREPQCRGPQIGCFRREGGFIAPAYISLSLVMACPPRRSHSGGFP